MTTTSRSAPIPWTDSDVLRLCTTSALGLVAVAVSWYGSSGSANTGTQALWFNIGVAGLVLSALGNAVWILRGRRAIGIRREELVSLAATDTPREEIAGKSPSVNETLTLPLGAVRAEGMSRLHRPDCPLVQGKTVEPANLAVGAPCGVCLP